MFKYNLMNWYWIVDGSTTFVFSSASHSYVRADDNTYLAWLASGGIPTKISSADLPNVVNEPIIEQLKAVDAASSRALRAILLAQHNGQTPNPADVSTLAAYEAQAAALRARLVR